MNVPLVLNLLGRICIYFSLIFSVPIATAAYYGENLLPFLIAAATSFTVGLILSIMKPESEVVKYREGYAIVGLGWLIVSIIGALPYMYIGVSPLDAFFEAMSGFTTTGATIFDTVEDLPRSILLWRSLTQWLGGMGIVVLFVAIFPAIAKMGEPLLHAEVPGIRLSKLKPKLKDTAILLYTAYFVFTVLEISLLYILGLDFYDAINHAFTTLSTGGFSTHTQSISYYNNPAVESVITLFMFIGGANFALLYFLLRGNFRIIRDAEFRVYAFILSMAVLVLAILNLDTYSSIIESIRYSVFQAVAIMTTTGYTTYDFDTWNDSAKLVLLILMFVGGSSGSTAGGIKAGRMYLLTIYSIIQIQKAAEPRRARVVKFGGEVIKSELLDEVAAFFVLYIVIFVISVFLVSISGLDMITSISAVAATINNVGPALGAAGASETYSALPWFAKLILSIDMWMGRLELFAVISLFIPTFWREKW
jgi:trk system potassium uptake protein TrkH